MSPTTARASSSEDETERSAELNESKRSRRRRGRRTRKKSERDSPASEFSSRAATPPYEGRKRTCSLGAPPAPRNTNDFLLADMEKREEDSAKRVRREQLESEIASGTKEEELTGEDEFEDQYEESWQECVVDKYKEMSHDELARKMASMEKNRDEVERKLRWERSKSDYLQERLLEAEEQIRHQEDATPSFPSSDSPPPPPPVPSHPPPSAYCNLPLLGSNSPNCSPNMISSPRA
ncbi:hypothetical protein PRIPAC_93654 [Pristionchus pacificus]|uniref:Uncharacterized protein n=1 Tax=Pristionchus pacificus TaxID=54126 RepID=A0A2A6BIK8_PRIPA|nr:hypothetical protein PRIPAC_93654 [Pristionchus pacificus]|eukprot:PDM65732.1 hypothetical protein PRIPAC_45646 [Pristionchus pacificus]